MAAAANDYFFGFDMLLKTVQNNLEQKTDVLVLLAHFMLVKKGFRCIGVGEEKSVEADAKGEELLPDGWNAERDKYALRYLHDNKLYLLLGHQAGNLLIVNLLNVESKQVSNVGLDPDELVKTLKGKLSEMVPEASTLLERFRTELLEPVSCSNSKNMETQTIAPQGHTINDPLMVGGPRIPAFFPVPSGLVAFEPFRGIGSGDLDPLGRGPGNLFPLPGGQGRGFRPLRPRFDPHSPNPHFGHEPDPDHFAPPNFNPGYM